MSVFRAELFIFLDPKIIFASGFSELRIFSLIAISFGLTMPTAKCKPN